MFNKLSLKIGLLFFVFILIIEAFLFSTLYFTLVDERVEEVMENLLARGDTHSEVLEDSFEEMTLEHVGMMEAATDFIAVITDGEGEILINSDALEPEMLTVLKHTDFAEMPIYGKIVEKNWQKKRYIATDSPITIHDEHVGHVFMFAPTKDIKRIVDHLKNQFLLVGIITVFLTIVTILLLSRIITLPLIRMKEATEQLSQGDNQVDLTSDRNDELGELANAITKLSTDLDRLKNARNEFLSSISHELRTPLTYIKGYADILDRSDTTEREREEYMGIIREEAAHLTVLVGNLFELAKLDRNQFTIQKQDVSIVELLTSIAVLVKPAFDDQEIELSVNCEEDVPASIDPERIQQVLLNILDNARKHSFAGGRVTIECRQEAGDITICITDEGQGIPEEELPFVFDRLYRVEKSRSRERGGSGLGLAIAKEIVESHGGQIWMDSQFGEGTAVTVQLKRGVDHS
ncbi:MULTISPECIES: HAMP domain-containing sensor histidine kinase [Planococcus]|uniref:histidine kinase n=1 Tax=Planococcus faecalis TaxID=1598147 RepID=A0ABN4XLP0_9BACL|nr:MULTISPECIES: HAMP domain-containing sensor histidine kinase [Planococcus]AQU78365.1 two-component sensor histidine kinase [Planococcus faecalis]MDJ0331834.1 HAMP domain-containing sensor histidine kinase [Planococcus sp. S3-L1]OHX52432.1 two-component sensor histidine kinase [Planococcus faecalis]